VGTLFLWVISKNNSDDNFQKNDIPQKSAKFPNNSLIFQSKQNFLTFPDFAEKWEQCFYGLIAKITATTISNLP